MRPENRDGEGECYQVNGAVRAVYSNAERRLVSLEVNGAPVDDAATYSLILQGYHAKNAKPYLDLDAGGPHGARRRPGGGDLSPDGAQGVAGGAPERRPQGRGAAGLRGVASRIS